MGYTRNDLAVNGGPKVRTRENLPMFPGGLEIGAEEKKEVLEVLDSQYLFRYYGPKEMPSKVKRLEEEYAAYLDVKHCLAVSSCTAALITGLVAVGVEPGDEVIVPAYTFFASVAAVVAAKAIPIVCEVDKSLTLDPEDLERKITKRTKAVLPVHMRGMPAKMDRIMSIARKHNLKVVEDVAQSNGGSFAGQKLGSFGDVGAFSFQYHKIITAGEGGIVATNGDLLYTRAQAYHDVAACWRKDRFAPPEFAGEIFFGVNFRMSELHGAVALAQFHKLDSIVERMRSNRARIVSRMGQLKGVELREVNDVEGDTAVCLVLYLPEPGVVQPFVEALLAEGIEASGIFNKGVPDWHMYQHWTMLHGKMMYSKKGCPFNCPLCDPVPEYKPDACPQTAAWLGRSVHLDIPPQLTEADCDEIGEGIQKVASVLL
ncbi:MAG: DegT/DnrJ/EryC1/StrS family aminotransferase [Spirochaetales bacterium]|nr:DegT/DnrJ/EryC1/StrS family aminotransferase [Spirochaetales bacterium]